MNKRTCSVCDRIHYSKGFCQLHYNRSLRGADLTKPFQYHVPKETTAYDRVMGYAVWDGDCLVYTRALDLNGYGRVSIPGTDRSMLAHRVVMEHHFGISKKYVLHSCNNPPCVNVEHLRYGTQADNMADALKAGNRSGGTLTDEDVVAIRNDPRGRREIASDYGISPGYVYEVKTGRRRS